MIKMDMKFSHALGVIRKLKEIFNAKRFLEDGGENDNLGC